MSEPRLDERIQIRVPGGTRAVLYERARSNRRTIGQEAAYLIEKGLETEKAASGQVSNA